MHSSNVIEVVQFKPKEGIDKDTFTTAAGSIEAFINHQAGFIQRELAVNEDGMWIDIVHWTDLASAQQAAQAALESPACAPFFGMIDEHNMTMHHFQSVLTSRVA